MIALYLSNIQNDHYYFFQPLIESLDLFCYDNELSKRDLDASLETVLTSI